jgi:hypothetical protein
MRQLQLTMVGITFTPASYVAKRQELKSGCPLLHRFKAKHVGQSGNRGKIVGFRSGIKESHASERKSVHKPVDTPAC